MSANEMEATGNDAHGHVERARPAWYPLMDRSHSGP